MTETISGYKNLLLYLRNGWILLDWGVGFELKRNNQYFDADGRSVQALIKRKLIQRDGESEGAVVWKWKRE